MTRWIVRIVMATCAVGLIGMLPDQTRFEAVADVDVSAALELPSSEFATSEPLELEEVPAMRLSMEFEEVRLNDVLKAFSQQTGINVIATEAVGDQTITLYLEDVAVMDALDQILEASGLTFERPTDSQIYIVKPRSVTPEQTVTVTRVYRLKYARVSESRLARAAEALAEFVPAGIGTGGGGGGGGDTGSSDGGGGSSGGGGASTAGSVGLGSAGVGIDIVLQGLLTDVGEVEVDGRTNSLIVTDIEENFPRIESVLRALDIRTAQLLIEAELLETTVGKLKDLGFEWGTGTEGDFLDFTLGQRSTRFPFGGLGRFAPEISDSDRKFTASTIDASDTVGILQALERDTGTTILARPKILTLDNERAIIQLTTDQAVGFESTSGETSGTTTTTPQRTTTGIILVVTPQINADGYVTMVVEPSVTKVVTASVTPPASLGTVVDPKTRSARAMVRVRDGDTLVIGGLIDRTEEEIERRVPGLASIPLLGKLFRNREINDSASELIVFVTPRIIMEPVGRQVAAAEQELSLPSRAQEDVPSRQKAMERTLHRLEQ